MIISDSRILSIEKVRRNPNQPRDHFDEDELQQLADSIKQYGLLEPVGVRQDGEDSYILIHGERRWRASQLAGLDTIRAEIADVDEAGAYVLSLIENEQRQNLRPIETAKALKVMMDAEDLTQGAVAERISRSRDWVAQKLRLLNLPTEVRDMIGESLTENHGRQLLKLSRQDNPDKMVALATKAKEETWSVARLSTEVNLALARPKEGSVLKPTGICHYEGECEHQIFPTNPPGQSKTHNHDVAFNIVLRDYKNRAVRTGKQWALSDELFREMLSSNCHYCGIPPYKTHPRSVDYIYNGVDRIDSNLGYTPENVVSCCEICNKAKRNLTVGEFLTWLARICKHQGSVLQHWGQSVSVQKQGVA